MSKAREVLHSHWVRPCNNVSLPVEHGYGIVTDHDGRHAVRIGFALDARDNIADVAFRAYGDPILNACASFLMQTLHGQALRLVSVTSRMLERVLELDPDKTWCATMVVNALCLALTNQRTYGLPFMRSTCPTRAVRCPSAVGSRPAARPDDRRLLQAGETITQLLRERAQVIDTLRNLDLLLQVGLSSSCTSRSNKGSLSCHIPHLKTIIPHLEASDRHLIALVGVKGMSETQAARWLGVDVQSVHERMWDIARQVQSISRGSAVRLTSTRKEELVP